MDYNFSIYATSLTLESLDLLPCYVLPAFIFGILTYGVILLFNFIILLTIALNRKLHKPMYILLFNLPVNDLIGATAFFPQLVSSILLQTRTITYSACFIQALLVHLYGVGSLVILSAMICSTKIVDIFCNNPSLMKLVCGDINSNNYFGLFVMVFSQGLSLMIVLFTYIQILFTCISRRQSDAKRKAIQTCGTHLIVFLLCTTVILSYRLQNVSPNAQKLCGIMTFTVPPVVNPIIYGMHTKDIRIAFLMVLKKIKVTFR
uniref:G-protein coupled receptors family 1 profile domain-containing protein n=1 Tax=Electrophorus electricus TaxID=8005 RepID=A0A4W4DTK3_ELEEL